MGTLSGGAGENLQTLLVTGGAGFIGSNFIHYLLENYPDCRIINLDKLTYAGNLDNLRDVENDPRYCFIKEDIASPRLAGPAVFDLRPAVCGLAACCGNRPVDAIINFAAETHVDRSINDARPFIHTDVLGTQNLLEVARRWGVKRYLQISTDEVYGSIKEGSSIESDALRPTNPYSASKAAGDLQVLAYVHTYGLPALITRPSNNFGPYQYPEKLIPLFVTNLLEGKKVPVYGDGKNVRDWIYVGDNCAAIDLVLRRGVLGEVYNISGENERNNLEMTGIILDECGSGQEMIEYVADRPGHDRRYSLDCSKVKQLGWQPSPRERFENALRETVRWYRDNRWWWEKRLAAN